MVLQVSEGIQSRALVGVQGKKPREAPILYFMLPEMVKILTLMGQFFSVGMLIMKLWKRKLSTRLQKDFLLGRKVLSRTFM